MLRHPYKVGIDIAMSVARTLTPRTTLRAYAANVDWSTFRCAVSLHAHTQHSCEVLSDLPACISRIPVIGPRVGRGLERRVAAEPLDLARGWWHPPVTPRQVFESEASQIDRRFGLDSLVSLTDHDQIAAGLEARRLFAGRRAPISIEWTVPDHDGFFHLGVHDLPEATAGDWLARLAAFTHGVGADVLRDILGDLRTSGALLVFNHPMWDLAGVGERTHARRLREFLDRHQRHLDALELNGYRSCAENGAVRRVSAERGLPLISGGDRHTLAPNAMVNLTCAESFAEFAAEVRDGLSHIVVMPEYREHLASRILASTSDVLRFYGCHPVGWQRWFDRVSCESAGQLRPLSDRWPGGGPFWVRSAIRTLRVISSPRLLPIWRAALQRLDRPPRVSPIPSTS